MWTDDELARVFRYLISNHAGGLPGQRSPMPVSTLPFDMKNAVEVARDQLEAAIANKHEGVVEAALWLARVGGMPDETYFMLACRLVAEDWHHSHEALIRTFQDAEDPRAVPYLRQAIDLKPVLAYLDYDDYGAYYKKCLWALRAIGTDDAVSVIEDCANSDIETLRDEAHYRLKKMGQ